VTKILPLLTAASADHPSFHVVAPSLPGYAWSEGVLEEGFQAKHYAGLFNKLMISLGYSEYVTQGGDWGHVLTMTMASKYGPQHVKASHTNMPRGEPPKLFSHPIVLLKCLITSFTSREREAAAATQSFLKNGLGFLAVQSTKPQTIGFSLADSPVGLLAWIYEKLVTCSDAYPWTDDEVLTWISIYWFSRAGPAASVRIYYELTASGDMLTSPRRPSRSACPFSPRSLSNYQKLYYVPKGMSCSSRSTRSADTLQPTNSPKHSWVTFGICLGGLGLQQVPFRDIPATELKRRLVVDHILTIGR